MSRLAEQPLDGLTETDAYWRDRAAEIMATIQYGPEDIGAAALHEMAGIAPWYVARA